MLNDDQILTVWERQIGAEVRALYFAEIASERTRLKQIFTGVTFFLSSGAAATVIAKTATWVPISLSIAVALITAYSIAVSLDGSIRTMAKFHYSWSELSSDYERLWSNVYGDDADAQLDTLISRERDLSEAATTDAPNNQKQLLYWQEYVFRQHHLDSSENNSASELAKA